MVHWLKTLLSDQCRCHSQRWAASHIPAPEHNQHHRQNSATTPMAAPIFAIRFILPPFFNSIFQKNTILAVLFAIEAIIVSI